MKKNTLENMTLQRDLWRERALNDASAMGEMKLAADAQHARYQELERLAVEAVTAGAAYAELLDAIMGGTTGIGGAL